MVSARDGAPEVLVKTCSDPENRSFENFSIAVFKWIFDILLLNKLFILFLNLFSSVIELKNSIINNLFISFLNLFISWIVVKTIYYNNTGLVLK